MFTLQKLKDLHYDGVLFPYLFVMITAGFINLSSMYYMMSTGVASGSTYMTDLITLGWIDFLPTVQYYLHGFMYFAEMNGMLFLFLSAFYGIPVGGMVMLYFIFD